MAAVLGIDLTAGKRPSGYAVLDAAGRLLDLGDVLTDQEIIELAALCSAAVVAIDAPLSLPLGVCCFDETHDCAPLLPGRGKASERALSALGIPCYYTSKRSIIKDMVLRAMDLSAALTTRGHEVIEVYPYSVKVRLWGRNIPRKTTAAGMAFLRTHLTDLFPDLETMLQHNQVKLTHDVADGLLAAYTGFLYQNGRTEALGHPDEGYIIVPHTAAVAE